MNPVLQKSATIHRSDERLDPAGFERHITFQTYVPPVSLASFVKHFWILSWDRAGQQPYISEQVMHRPYVDVYLSRHDSGIQCTFRGKRDYAAVDTGRIVGARFSPGAFRAIWHESLADMHNETIALQTVFPEAGHTFIEHTLALPDEAAVGALAELILAHNPQPDPNIGLINEIITLVETENLPTVRDVAQRLGRSERRVQQLFQEYVGIGLKWQLQRIKLLQAARFIRENSDFTWSDLAYDLGYSSQQHFITDFKRVLGRTPMQYKRELDASDAGFS